ncbi:hypothetical protein BUALT_Bualt16G0112300 [Buddleja alternifolia]|uniref:Uncharacterized protein n=1 Tax=Buddleja alternifolia TaxID=168488 RepID=A0AAV6WJ24_9LAMI|nr:hypothetical protein BUALT_Bualt16G0112300 [Buddleja alternifolia]
MESRTPVASVLEPWLRLENKVVMVTGASSGLGREFCLDLAKAGCRVIAAARRLDRLQSLCEEINNMIGSSSSSNEPGKDQAIAVAVELDVSASGSSIEACVQKAWDAFGRIDALINNAGIRGLAATEVTEADRGERCVSGRGTAQRASGGRVHTSLDLLEKEWNDTIGTNLTGTWLVSKYVCMRMCDTKQGGSIVNISSLAGLERPLPPGTLAYACSKVAINTLTKVMALELGAYNIRVNAISPGIFKSEITEGLFQKNWLKKIEQKTIPLRTFGTSDPALTSLIRYLIHNSSDHVTGNIFIVDAGNTLPGVPIFSSL